MKRTLKLFKGTLATLLALLMMLSMLQSALAGASGFPLLTIDRKLIADADTRYIVDLNQDAGTKVIVATFMIKNGNPSEEIKIIGTSFELTFDYRIAPYNRTNNTIYQGGLNRTTDILRYIQMTHTGASSDIKFNQPGSYAFRSDSVGRFIGIQINAAGADDILVIAPNSTETVAQVYFKPINGTDNLEASMFKFQYIDRTVLPEGDGLQLYKLGTWLGNGSNLLVATAGSANASDNYVLSPSSFKMHIHLPQPKVFAYANGAINGYDSATMQWSVSENGPWNDTPPPAVTSSQQTWVRSKGTDYTGTDGEYVNYKLSYASPSIQVPFTELPVPTTIDVTFNPNGGTLAGSATNTYTIGQPYGSLPEPERTGYNFTGWYTASTGGTLVTNASMVSGYNNLTLFAQWDKIPPVIISVTFDPNGGTLEGQATKPFTVNEAYGTLPNASRTKYKFDGWYTAATGGTKVTAATIVENTGGHTLYAQWTLAIVTATFDPSFGTLTGSSSKDVIIGETYGNLPSASRIGYDFTGWRTGGNLITAESIVTATGDHTVYAGWQPKTIPLTLVLNGGQLPGTAPVSVTYDQTYSELPDVTKYGYTFLGWYTAQTGGVRVTNETVVNTTTNITLYARWAPNTISVSFDPNGGTLAGKSPINVVFGEPYDDYEVFPTASQSGYTFAGWFTEATGGVRVISESNVSIDGAHTLYAHWTANTYVLTLDPNGGTLSGAPSRGVTFGQPYGAFATANKNGSNFAGWYTAPTGGDLVTADSIVSTAGNHTLYAQWTAMTVTLTYDPNGGTANSDTTKPVTYGEPYGAHAAVSRTGYSLVGWFTAPVGGTQVLPTDTVSITSNHTLYAHWSANTYLVSFDPNGGTMPVTTPITVAFDGPYGTRVTATRDGYNFDGWFTAQTGGSLVEATTIVSIASDHTLYAHWTIKTAIVTFDPNGGTLVGTSPITYTFGETYSKMPTATRTGYTFNGWYTAQSGGTLVTDTTTVTNASNHTLYAHWSPNTLLVTLDPAGGTVNGDSQKTVVFDAQYGSLPPASRDGYTFDGWYTAQTGGTPVITTTIVANPAAHTLYAQWTLIPPTTVYVSFDPNGGTLVGTSPIEYTIGDTYKILPGATKTGYTFLGWFTAATGGKLVTVTSEIADEIDYTLYAHWSPNTLSVTLDPTGGIADGDLITNVTFDAPYGALPNATKNGYTFNGWFTAPTGGTRVLATTIVTNPAAHTLYAQWTAVSVTVTFDPNGGTLDGTSPVIYTFGEAYSKMPTATRTGYAFNGWYTAQTGGTLVTDTTAVTNASNHTLYAHWMPNTLSVTLDPTGGMVNGDSIINVTFDAPYGALPNATKNGYTFIGWHTAQNGGTLVVATTIVTNPAAHTLYAQWTLIPPTTVNVSFDPNGGTLDGRTPINYTIGETYRQLPGANRTGYTFLGWYTAITGGTLVTESSTVPNSSDFTLYAHWSPNTLSVTFDPNGGILSGSSQMNVVFDAPYGTLPTATKNGYVFNGWFTAQTDGTLVVATTIVTNPAAHTLYAQWTAMTMTVTFDPTGGTVDPTSKTVTFGQLYGTLPTATRAGYTFDGWFNAPAGEAIITPNNYVITPGDHIIYAQWTLIPPSTVNVSFDPNGGTLDGRTPIIYTIGETYRQLPGANRTGYTFLGWYTAITGGTLVTESSTVPNSSDFTLYAHWSPNTMSVTFDPNGGTLIGDSQKNVVFDAPYGTLPTATRVGYTFNGWFTAQAGGMRILETTVVTNATAHTLYAQWSAMTVSVTFDPNGGTLVGTSPITYTFGEAYSKMPTATRTGYSFNGWYTEQAGGTLVTDTTTVTNASNHTLYAHWTANIRFVTFDANGGAIDGEPFVTKPVTVGEAYGELPVATRSGFTFSGWYTELDAGTLITAASVVTNPLDHTLYAKWTPVPPATAIVTFDPDGGTFINGTSPVTLTVGQPYGTLPTVIKTGFVFDGWFTDLSSWQLVEATDIVPAGNHTIYAHWLPDGHLVPIITITLDPNGGTVAATEIKIYAGETLPSIPAATRLGYIFKGWYTELTGGDLIKEDTEFFVSCTIYARWEYSGVPVTTIRITDASGNPISAMYSVTRNSKLTFSIALNDMANYDSIVWSVSDTAYATVTYSPADPRTATVSIKSKTGTVVLTVRDTATGVSTSIVLRIA